MEEGSIKIPEHVTAREERMYSDIVASRDVSLKAIMLDVIEYNKIIRSELNTKMIKKLTNLYQDCKCMRKEKLKYKIFMEAISNKGCYDMFKNFEPSDFSA